LVRSTLRYDDRGDALAGARTADDGSFFRSDRIEKLDALFCRGAHVLRHYLDLP